MKSLESIKKDLAMEITMPKYLLEDNYSNH